MLQQSLLTRGFTFCVSVTQSQVQSEASDPSDSSPGQQQPKCVTTPTLSFSLLLITRHFIISPHPKEKGESSTVRHSERERPQSYNFYYSKYKLYHKHVCIGKKPVYIGISTIHGFRQPLGGLGTYPPLDKGNYLLHQQNQTGTQSQ